MRRRHGRRSAALRLCVVPLLAVLLLAVTLLPRAVPAVQAASGDAGLDDPLATGSGARERALASGVAAARGPAALGWNPALLTATRQLTVQAHFAPLAAGGSYDFAGVAGPLGAGSAGIGLTRLGAGGIAGYDAASLATGTLSFTDGELGLGYAVELAGGLAAGVLVRYRWQTLGAAGAGGAGVDLGLAARPARWPALTLGARLRGALSPALSLGQEADRLPRTLELGVSLERRLGGRPVVWVADTALGRSAGRLGLGAEARLSERLGVRLGLRRGQPRFGLGLAAGFLDLDYLVEVRDLGIQHGVSLTAHLGRGARRRLETAAAAARAAGVADARRARGAEIEGYRQTARRLQAVGETERAGQLWQAVAVQVPGDLEAAAALDRLAVEEAAAVRDSLRAVASAATSAGRRAAVARALDAGELGAAALLLEELAAAGAAPADVQELENRLASRQAAARAALRSAARRQQRAGALAAAVADWSRLLLLDPGDAEAAAGIRQAQQRLAALEAERAQRSTEVAQLALLVRAFEAFSAGEFVLSETLVDSLLAGPAPPPSAAELKRRLARRTGPPAARVTAGTRALYITGMRHFNAGRYAEAIAAWERILGLDPDNDPVRRNIDEARARLGLEGEGRGAGAGGAE